MSIDLSLKSPGVSIINFEQKKVIYNDNFEDKKYKSEVFWDRLEIVCDYIEDIFDTFKPSIVMIENAFMASRTANSNMPLIMARGRVLSMIRRKGATVKGIMPSSARAFLKIKPNTKEAGFEWVKNNFPELNLTDFKKHNDRSDAVIVSLNALNPKCDLIF